MGDGVGDSVVSHEDFAGHVVEDFPAFSGVCEVGGVLGDQGDSGVGVAGLEDELVQCLPPGFVVEKGACFVD